MRFSVWAFLGVIAIGVGLWVALPRLPLLSLVFGEREDTPLNDLPRASVRDALSLEDGLGTDRLVFRDARNGWFVIDDVAQAAEMQIGVYGSRFIDILGSGRHVPIYCGGTSADRARILWRLHGGEVTRAIAFCNPRRFDLGGLIALGAPVVERHEQLERAAAQARIKEVQADPMRFLAGFDAEFVPYDEHVTVVLPAMWWEGEGGPTYVGTQRPMLDRIQATLGPEGPRYKVESIIDRGLQWQNPSGEWRNALLKDGDGYIALPDGFHTAQISVIINCVADFCETAIDAAKAAAPTAPRDPAVLERALTGATAVESSASAMTVEELRADTVTTLFRPILYSVRDFSRAP